MKIRLFKCKFLIMLFAFIIFEPFLGLADVPCTSPPPIGCEQKLVDGYKQIPTLTSSKTIECRKSVFEPSCKGTEEIYDYQPVSDLVCVTDVRTVQAMAGYVLVDCSKCPAGTQKVPFYVPVTTGRYCVGPLVGYFYP